MSLKLCNLNSVHLETYWYIGWHEIPVMWAYCCVETGTAKSVDTCAADYIEILFLIFLSILLFRYFPYIKTALALLKIAMKLFVILPLVSVLNINININLWNNKS